MPPAQHANPNVHPAHTGRRKHIDWVTRTVRLELFVVALLIAIVSLYVAFNGTLNTTGGEFKRVDSKKYQAVFLNGGVTSGSVSYSTYFGHIKKLNDKYAVLTDVYYLTDQSTATGSSSSASSPQLTKLGCQQLHSPYDQMVINRSQVAFWENLKDDGKVVQAIQQFQKQNPTGPNCTASNPATPPASSH